MLNSKFDSKVATKPKKHRVRLYGLNAGRDPNKHRERPKSDARYHTWRWQKASQRFRREHPLCEECLRRGVYTPSKVVDHIIPVALSDDFWDESNWQALCQACNIAKGNRDKKYIQGKEKL